MRVQTGTAKGSRLKSPRHGGVRPTSGRVKGALFNILTVAGLQEARVLELYAGTGALGIEALSRGAAWVDFVERDEAQCRQISQNLKAAGLAHKAKVHRAPAEKTPQLVEGPFDVMLLDPPYAERALDGLLKALASLLGAEGTLVLEHSARAVAPDASPALHLHETRRYGDSALSFYRKAAA